MNEYLKERLRALEETLGTLKHDNPTKRECTMYNYTKGQIDLIKEMMVAQ